MIYTIACCNSSLKSHPLIAKQSSPIESSLDCGAIVKGSTNFPLFAPANIPSRTVIKKPEDPLMAAIAAKG